MTDTIDVAALVEPVAWMRTEVELYPGASPRVDFTRDPEIAELWRLNAYTAKLEALVPATALQSQAASLTTMREALEANEKLMLVNKVRHVAEEVAPLWLQNADRLTARAIGGSNAE